MAYLQKRGEVWHIRWRDKEGKQHSRSTGLKKKRDANLMLAELEVENSKRRVLTNQSTFREAWARFEIEHLPTVRESTQKNYRTAGRRFFNPHFADMKLRDVDSSLIQEFLNNLNKATTAPTEVHEHRVSPRRVVNLQMLLSGFFTWCVKRELLYVSPMKKVNRQELSDTVELKTVNQRQMALILTCCEIDWRIHLSILYFCGLRLGELRALRWEDYSTTRDSLRVRNNVYRNGRTMIDSREDKLPFSDVKSKSGRRIVPISPTVAELLDGWKAESHLDGPRNPYGLIFPGPDDGVMPEHLIREKLREATELAEAVWEAQRDQGDDEFREPLVAKNITPRTLRHGFARLMLECGLTIVETMALMGHSSVEQTRAYAEWEINHDTKAARLQEQVFGSNQGRSGFNKWALSWDKT